ncbi:hypothetical protein NXS19_002686 [Fusarium pseudograminearum]|nr:hypothetical protein NXS19_002686 [Fusarium pseudograminearum]
MNPCLAFTVGSRAGTPGPPRLKGTPYALHDPHRFVWTLTIRLERRTSDYLQSNIPGAPISARYFSRSSLTR